MYELGFPDDFFGIPFFIRVANIICVFPRPEFPCEEVIGTVWYDQGAVFVEVVDNFHVVVTRRSFGNCFEYAMEFKFGWSDENHLRAHYPVIKIEPICTRHCYWGWWT
jgi:hypothetical protein